VRGQQRHQLIALAGLAPAALGVLLEPRIRAHLRRAARTRTTIGERRAAKTTRATRTGTTVGKRRTRTTRAARATIGERRAGTTWATVAKRRARARWPIAERWTRTRNPGHRGRQSFETCAALAATLWAPEPLATAGRATTAALATALAATAATTTAGAATTTTATRPDRHVATTTVVVVHPATVGALASAATVTVAV
jgi:hypothetical protein